MEELLRSPFFGVTLTVLAYVLGIEKSAMPEYIARCIQEEA